jgi:hypothetical protein
MSRLKEIEAALRRLSPDAAVTPHAEQIEYVIANLDAFRQGNGAAPPRSTLENLAQAWQQLARAIERLDLAALVALNAEKHRRGAAWPPTHSTWTNIGHLRALLDAFPELAPIARAAASSAPRRPTRSHDEGLLAIAIAAGMAYSFLTGKKPPLGRGANGYNGLVADVFLAADIEANAIHYAALAAKRLKQQQ